MAISIFDERLRKRLPGIFPAQSLTSMQPVSDLSTAGVVEQEPIQSRTSIDDYMRIQSAINRYESKQDAMPNLIRKMVGRSGSLPATGASSSADLKYIMGQTDKNIQDVILERQGAAILRGDINNIDEQMAWYQKGGYDPHFAKEARTAAQSIFDQRFQETGAETAKKVEARAVLGEARAVDAAARAQENLDINIAKERRAAATNARQSTDRSRADVRATREDSILEWMVREYETRSSVAGADPVAIWDDVKSEGMGHARDKGFIGFEMVAGEYIPRESEDPSYTAKQTTGINLDEKRIFDEFKNEIPRPSVKDDKDEDFITVPARDYFDTYKEGWDAAADDFLKSRQYKEDIDTAIQADPNIAQKDKQAVFEKVVSSLESLEKSVVRPTEPTERAYLKKERDIENRLHGKTDDLPGDIANKTRVYIEIMDEYLGGNIFLEGMTKGLREAMVYDRMIKIMSYGPNPIHRIKVEQLQKLVSESVDETAAKELIVQFSQAYRIPAEMADYLSNPEAFKKRKF